MALVLLAAGASLAVLLRSLLGRGGEAERAALVPVDGGEGAGGERAGAPRLGAVWDRCFGAADELGVRRSLVLVRSALLGLAAALVAQQLLGWPVATVAAGLVGAAWPWQGLARRRARSRDAFEEGFADVVAALRDAVRAGIPLADAIVMLHRTAPPVLQPVLHGLERNLRRRMRLDVALEQARSEVASAHFDLVAAAVATAYRAGGAGLGGLLDDLSELVRGEVTMRRMAAAEQAGLRLTSMVLTALPLGLLVVQRLLRPDYMEPFNTAAGQVMLGVVFVLLAAQRLLLRRAATLPTAVPRLRPGVRS